MQKKKKIYTIYVYIHHRLHVHHLNHELRHWLSQELVLERSDLEKPPWQQELDWNQTWWSGKLHPGQMHWQVKSFPMPLYVPRTIVAFATGSRSGHAQHFETFPQYFVFTIDQPLKPPKQASLYGLQLYDLTYTCVIELQTTEQDVGQITACA